MYIPLPNAIMMMLVITTARNLYAEFGKTERKEERRKEFGSIRRRCCHSS